MPFSKKIFFILLFFISMIFSFQGCINQQESLFASTNMPDSISYNFDIRPILSDKCFSCHGPDINKRKANLRLDQSESAYQALKEHPMAHALVPGNPDLSEVFVRVSSKDSNLVMPPHNSNLKLSQHEIDLIEKWIKQGARYEKHWAFVAPVKKPLPLVNNANWPKNEYSQMRKRIEKDY
jgi:hypothetical protein